MDLNQTLALALKVIADWRVIFVTLAVLLLWAALRYVGTVYHRRAPRRPSAPRSLKAPAARGRSAAQAPAEASDEGMIE